MASDLERAVRSSKRFEALLTKQHNATGRGLHEKIDSVEDRLDPDTVRALRLVATVRNRIVHEEGYNRIDGRRSFREACGVAERALQPRGVPKAMILLVIIVVILGVAAWRFM